MASLSVITPTYNRHLTLGRVWASLSRQTFADFEWIVVDDGSTDETREFFKEILDQRVVYLYQDNAGPGPARNLGIRHATAEFLTFLDSDDEYADAWALDTMMREADRMESDVGIVNFRQIYCGTDKFVGHIDTESKSVVLSEEEIIGFRRTYGNMVHICRRAVFSSAMFPSYRTGGEHLLFWTVARQWKFKYINTALVVYHDEGRDRISVENSYRSLEEKTRMARELVANFPDIGLRDPESWNDVVLTACMDMCKLGQRWSAIAFVRMHIIGRVPRDRMAKLLLLLIAGRSGTSVGKWLVGFTRSVVERVRLF